MPFLRILWPTFALVALIFVVWVATIVHRSGLFLRDPPAPEDVAANGENALPYSVGAAANNYHRLFEMPVLYLALVPLLMLTHSASHVQVALAWIFVILRALQSLIHIASKKVMASGWMFLFSTLALLAMWAIFFVDMLTAVDRYNVAMQNFMM